MLIMAKLSDFMQPAQMKQLAEMIANAVNLKFGKVGIVIEKGQVKYFTSEVSLPANGSCDEEMIAK